MIWHDLSRKLKLKLVIFLLLVFTAVFVVFQLSPKQPQLVKIESNYAIHIRQNFNQPTFYPVTKIPPENLYKPVAKWIGRLILPTNQQLQDGLDWVWMEVQSAPATAEDLVGKIVRLEWQKNQDLLTYIQAVTRDVNFTPEVIRSQKEGIIHPFRLNGIRQVGVLRSLAGANPNDDVIVALDANTIITKSEEKSILKVDHEPVIITGRFYSLVKIIKPTEPNLKSNPKTILPPKQKHYHDYFLVKHYNLNSHNFDGIEETIRIPQQVTDTRNFAPSTTLEIEKSPAGKEGWYIYGANDVNNVFVVQAIAPYSLFQIKPNQTITGEELGLNYIKKINWQNTEAKKGNLNTVFINPVKSKKFPSSENQYTSTWQKGDKAILLHLFGGIGGKKAEPLGVVETITGHFAFGTAEVIEDEFTNKLRFDIKYHQIYAHNLDGIIAGTHTWADFIGNLQHGWLSTRPVSDILIKYEPVTQDYDFDGVKISPLNQFQQKLGIAIARYRIGDGTGGAVVSPATSCVQDSSQALYATILAIKTQVAKNPQIQTWLKANPNHPQTSRFQQLIELGKSLEKQLVPLGIVRADWQSQADILAGTESFKDSSIWAGLTTWQTIMPRQVHDNIATIFLKHGATMQILRTNQVGGWQPDITPLAPTLFFGQIKIPFTDISPLSILLNRVLASLAIITFPDWLVIISTLVIYSLIAIPLGFKFGFLHLQIWSENWINKCLLILRCLFLPAIIEELFFRVLLLPHPNEITNWFKWSLWAFFTILLFVIYHPLNAKYFYKAGFPTFFNWVFLSLAALLGIACTIAYVLTGSFLVVVSIHWVVVVFWLIFLGGIGKLSEL
ncbi:CPBP family glutamic-type intramembrane protease [Brunnivagina elsteri]|uniref:CPBP family intramembrane metalloprotease domain-containing protein n=1 Tax=Brunnivagina elsteri CCALA 953 TaxID=987040 RepID=A0A2A2TFZ9_9CYAN|nr:CPBP family glutamic-type intramembrane protease [Calothrix elsteri]PAX52717.1 CPBP family intramembrane metalloprotease domain-containing protein [Calothrix elsteri CCALA 953]